MVQLSQPQILRRNRTHLARFSCEIDTDRSRGRKLLSHTLYIVFLRQDFNYILNYFGNSKDKPENRTKKSFVIKRFYYYGVYSTAKHPALQ